MFLFVPVLNKQVVRNFDYFEQLPKQCYFLYATGLQLENSGKRTRQTSPQGNTLLMIGAF